MKSKPQFVASGVGANWLPAARSLAMAALLALAATASAQNGTWTGADGATWNTTDTNWTGVTVPSTPWASPGTTANATFNATSGSASVSGTVFANTITYSPVGGNFSIANGNITLAGTTPTINNYDPAGSLTLASTVAGSAGLISRGSSTLVLAGNNTYTGTTTIRGGPLVLDYSGLSNTADPLSTGAVTLDMGTLTLKGKSSGSTSETISTLNMGANLGTANTLRLDSNGGSGIALSVSNFVMNTTAANVQNINLIDLSSSASNSITVGALGTGTARTNEVLMGNSNRANLVVRDSSGYGFATLSGATSGTIGRLSTGTTLNATLSSNTANYRLTSAGTLTRTANLDYSTITLDSTAGAVTLDMGANNLAPNGNGRGILITGPNDVSITGTGRLEGAAAAWFHNYSTGTFTYGLSTAASNGASLMFGGSGLTVWTGTSNKTSSSDSLYIEGGIFRPTAAQNWTTGFGVALGGVWVSSGAVLEVGADLNGGTAGDLSNTIGNTANSGQIRFWGSSGVSAFGANRSVNFGPGSSLTWGSNSFLTDAGGTGDGNYVFKLSSSRSDSTVTVQNAIALGSLNRTVEVANGSAATDAILSGVLSGTGGLVKSGAGALTLTNTNTYTGATTINAGTLSIAAITNGGVAGALGNSTNAAGSLVLGGGTLEYTGTANGTTNRDFTLTAGTTSGISVANSTVSLTISGNAAATTGGLTKSGAGTLTLNGTNTYTGATTINAGTLQIGAGSTTGSISSSSAITNNGTLAINRSDAITLSNTISGTGGLLKSGAGDLTLSGNNTYTGGTTLTNSVAGNLTMGANNALGNGALTFNATATARLLLNGTNQTVTGLTLFGSTASVVQNEGSSSSSLGTITFNLADGVTSNSTSNFYFRDSSDMGANRGKLALVKTGNGTLDFSTMNASSQGYSGGLTVNGGTFSYNSTAATAALGNSTAGGTITLGGGTLNYTGSTAQSISNNITLTAATTSTLNNANSTITVSGTIGGSGNITKGGAGTLILSGANAYTGDTIISAGTLQIGAGSTAGSISSSSAITNNGTLAINRSDATTLSNTISGTGNLTKLGANTLTLSGASANTYNGTTTVSAGNLTLDKTSGVVAVGGDLVLNGSSKLLYGTSKNEQIANTASVTINGTQSVFNGSSFNTNSGAIGVTETIASLTARDGQFNTGTGSNWTVTGTGVFDGSTGDTRFLGFSGSSISFNSLSLTAMTGTTIITDPDSFVMGGGSTTAVTTLSVGSGGLTLNGSTLGLNKGTPSTSHLGSRLILDGNITTIGSSASFIASNNGGTIGLSDIQLSSTAGSVTRTITTGSGADLTISVAITNGNATTGGIIKDGLGTLTLSGNNTYTGSTTINAGTLSIAAITNGGVAGALGNSTNAAGSLVLGGGTLEYTGTANGTTNRDFTLTAGTTSGISVANSTVSLTISGNAAATTGGLTKSGAGTLTLNGTNTYTGATTINAGTLQIGAGSTTGSISSSSAITNNGTLVINRSDAITLSNTISGTGNLAKLGTNTLTLSGASANTYNGTTTVSNGTLTLDKTSGVVAVGGDLVLNGSSKLLYGTSKNEQIANTASITLNGSQSVFNGSTWNSTTGTIQSNITETIGSLTVRDGQFNTGTTSNWTVTGAGVVDGSSGDARFAAFSGTRISFNSLSLTAMNGTTIGTSEDSFVLGGNQPNATTLTVGSGGLTLNGSTLGLNKGVNSGNAGSRLILDGNITTTGSSASFIASNLGTFGNSTIQLSSTAGSDNRTITTGSGADLTISVAITNGNATTAGIIKDGLGTLTLSGNNTYSGATTVAGGTLLLSGTGTLGTSTLSISGGTLDMGGKSFTNTFGSLTGGTLSNGTLTNNGGNYDLQNGTVSATLAGTNGVNKTGSGTVTLSNANTYNGTTTVTSGTLRVAATGALANTSSIDVNGGSLLVAVANSVNDNANITLRNGGRLAVNGNFDETVGALTLSANSTIDFSGFVGTLRFGSIASWAPGATLSIWNWSGTTRYGDQVNNYQTPSNLVFTNNATLTNNLANISFYSDSGTTLIGSGFERGFTGGGTEIIAVPEPETYLTGVILLLGGTIYLLRRAKHREGHRPAWPKFLHGIRRTTPGHHRAQKPPDPHPHR